MMDERYEPCTICEKYMADAMCDESDRCPVGRMKSEVMELRKKISKLEHEMSYMIGPNDFGFRHEMGG